MMPDDRQSSIDFAIPSWDEVRRRASHPDVATVIAHCDDYTRRYPSPPHGARLLVGLSGGADSVALLTLTRLLAGDRGWQLGAAHINYHLRADESEADEAFCRELTRTWDVDIHVTRPATPPSGTANIQTWARSLRYQYFKDISASDGYDFTLIGHHLEDRAENIAAAVIEASGTFALTGIPPYRDDIVRPLYDCRRREIIAFLSALGVPYREDQSNATPKYRRNRIRHEVLPALAQHNAEIVPGLARMGEQLWRQRRYLKTVAQQAVTDALREDGHGSIILDAVTCRDLDAALDPFVLRTISERLGLSIRIHATTVDRFTALREQSQGATQVEQGPLVISLSKGAIRFSRKAENTVISECTPVPVPGVAKIGGMVYRSRVMSAEQLKQVAGNDREAAHFDQARIDGAMTLRFPQEGDRYQPFGLSGSKKLHDLLADRGVPVFLRRTTPVLADASGILWPLGHPIAMRARVTASTREVLQVTAEAS